MARRKKGGDAPKGAPAWLLTYGDMMSLLLTFFVLLVSFSSIQESKFQAAITSLKGAFGIMAFPPTVVRQPEVLIPPPSESEDLQQILAEIDVIREELEKQGLEDQVEVSMDKDGIAIRISAPFLFESAKAELRAESLPVLDKLAAVLGRLSNSVRIEGHTDNVPIATAEFPSNWELSAARAITVLKYFHANGLPSQRLSAVGYGEFQPVASNDDEVGRRRNRRVEIYVEFKRLQRETGPLPGPALSKEDRGG